MLDSAKRARSAPSWRRPTPRTRATFRSTLTAASYQAASLWAAGGGGFRHVVEAARQIMGEAGDRQVEKKDIALVNG